MMTIRILHHIAQHFRSAGLDNFSLKPAHREMLRAVRAARDRSNDLVRDAPQVPGVPGREAGVRLGSGRSLG